MEHIFDIWPTTKEMADDLGKPYTTVASWRARGSIPPRHDPDVINAAQARGVVLSLQGLAMARLGFEPDLDTTPGPNTPASEDAA